MAATGKEYTFFLAALEREAALKWDRRLKALAMDAGIAPSSLTAIIKRRDNASFDTQVNLAKACGYSYPEFLIYGRSLVEGGKPEPKPSNSSIPQDVTEKISTFDDQDWAALSIWIEGYTAGVKKQEKRSKTK